MRTATNTIERQVKAFCAQIGADPLLVQGAGGNVSWKDEDILWVKASGTWIAEAESREIFVPVDYGHLQDAIGKQDFSVKPKVNNQSGLRPSIETLLHALMPHKVVAHLHPVEILANVICVNARQKIEKIIGKAFNWILVDYFKPGEDLARAVFQELKNRPNVDVIFLANHGVVIGGASVDAVESMLYKLTCMLKTKKVLSNYKSSSLAGLSNFISTGYIPCEDREINQLALKDELISRLRNDWTLYPDHVVFLGDKANILERVFTQHELAERIQLKSPFIFALGDGVYQTLDLTLAQSQQLRCYFDVVVRQDRAEKLSILNTSQVNDLLNWEAEIYRKTV